MEKKRNSVEKSNPLKIFFLKRQNQPFRKKTTALKKKKKFENKKQDSSHIKTNQTPLKKQTFFFF